MDNNIYQPDAGSNYHYGDIPITIDSSRNRPYIQYALVKQGDTILQPGESGANLPLQFDTGGAPGPIFSVSFMVHSETETDVTPEQFHNILKPTLTSAPEPDVLTVSENLMEWDSDSEEFSMWPATDIDVDKVVSLTLGQQHCVSTKPLGWDIFNNIKSGVVHFSLEPTANTEFDGLKIGILAVTYRMKLKRLTT